MRFRYGTLLLGLAYPAIIHSAQLKPVTLKAWETYVRAGDARLRSDAAARRLWIDGVPGMRARIKSGEVAVMPFNGQAVHAVPNGLIHDWIGAIYIPNVSMADVFATIQDYDNYSKYYDPTVRSAQLLDRTDHIRHFRVLYVRKALFVTVALKAEYEVQSIDMDDNHEYSIAHSTSVRQIANYGEPDERELPEDEGSGYMWRAASYVKFELRDGGVYMEQENVGLSRGIPVAWRWVVEPFVERLSRELVAGWLTRTRDAVVARSRGGAVSTP